MDVRLRCSAEYIDHLRGLDAENVENMYVKNQLLAEASHNRRAGPYGGILKHGCLNYEYRALRDSHTISCKGTVPASADATAMSCTRT